MLRLVAIGALGNMLSPAAAHLNKENVPGRFIRIYDRRPENELRQSRRESWQAQGTQIVTTYEALFDEDIDGVLICAGKNGDDLPILSQLIKVIIDTFPSDKRPFILHLSTLSVEFVAAAFEACRMAQIEYANYPLTGGEKGALAANMLILASGNKALFDRLEPLLSCLGQPKFFDTDITAAAKVKLIGHLMVFNGLLGISSAVALQSKALHLSSLTQNDFFDFLNQGAGGTRQWEVAIKQAVTKHEWQAGFLLPHATVDAIYTADLLIKYHLPAITVFPILQLACAFNFLLQNGLTQMATQTFLQALQRAPQDLDNFISQYQHYNPRQFLENVITALPSALQKKVRLDIHAQDFLGQ